MTEVRENLPASKTRSKRLLVFSGMTVAGYVLLAAWLWHAWKVHQRLKHESAAILQQTDLKSTRLTELEEQLKPRFAEQYLAMSRVLCILDLMKTQQIFPVTDGPAIVSSCKNPAEADGRYDRLNDGEQIRLVCYIPPGNHHLVHGFRSDRNHCSLNLPERVYHDAPTGQVHEVLISVRTVNKSACLMIRLDPSSPETKITEYELRGSRVTCKRRGMGTWCMIPNEHLGPCDAVADQVAIKHGWKYRSDFPNNLLQLDVSDEKNKFELRFGIESDAPASASAIILASRSLDFLRRVSEDGSRWKTPSGAERAFRSLFPDMSAPDQTPRIDDIFETPDGTDRLIFRKGWAEKTKEPW